MICNSRCLDGSPCLWSVADKEGEAPSTPWEGLALGFWSRFGRLGLVPLHRLPDGPGDEGVDALPSGGSVSADNIPMTLHNSNFNFVIVFFHVFTNCFLLCF